MTDIDRRALMMILKQFDEDMNEIGGYGDPDFEKILAALSQGDVESAVQEVYGNYGDQDGGEIRSNDFDNYIEDLEDQFKDLVGGSDDDELNKRPEDSTFEAIMRLVNYKK
jgi:hypothetical protein